MNRPVFRGGSLLLLRTLDKKRMKEYNVYVNKLPERKNANDKKAAVVHACRADRRERIVITRVIRHGECPIASQGRFACRL